MEIDLTALVVTAVVTAGVSAVFSAVATVLVIKVDLRWMKDAHSKLEARVDEHDDEIRQLQLGAS